VCDVAFIVVGQELDLGPAVHRRAVRVAVIALALLHYFFMFGTRFDNDCTTTTHTGVPLEC